jgi:hypothetical protein
MCLSTDMHATRQVLMERCSSDRRTAHFVASYCTGFILLTDGRQLRDVEQRALLLLNAASSGVSVLDDEELIDTLTEARVCY